MRELIEDVDRLARPLRDLGDLNDLIAMSSGARVVLLGEASHGTGEYHHWRMRISETLIRDASFRYIAVEGDADACARVNDYVQGGPSAGGSARDVLTSFQRWPAWTWGSEEMVELVEWLHAFNSGREPADRVAFHGLDERGLWEGLRAASAYLRREHPELLEGVRQVARCFEPHGQNAREMAMAKQWLLAGKEEEIARAVGEGEYFAKILRGGPQAWNAREQRMMAALTRIAAAAADGEERKGLVFAHNAHVGDALYSDMVECGMVSLGQLARASLGEDNVVLVGFSSYRGTVQAGREWDAPMQRLPLPPAVHGSWEEILHAAGASDKYLMFADEEVSEAMLQPRGLRSVGVVYRPERELYGNYVPTVLPRRYDALLHLDVTDALHPLPPIESCPDAASALL